MAVLRAKQKEVEAIEAMLAKMMDELKVLNAITYLLKVISICKEHIHHNFLIIILQI